MSRVTERFMQVVTDAFIDGNADQFASFSIPAGAALTVVWTYTVPVGFVGILRGLAVSYPQTSAIAPADIRGLFRLTRPGGIQVDILDWFNRSPVSEHDMFSCQIAMPAGSILQADAANRNAAARFIRMSAVIDLIRV